MSRPIAELRSPAQARTALDKLDGRRENIQRTRQEKIIQLLEKTQYLAVTEQVKQALDAFSEQLFGELINDLQTYLTDALHDVLDQPIALKVERSMARGAVTLAFHVERTGQRENIIKGQGGSVVNILSVGLRLLALAAAQEKEHRRFLILDEQDCWLRPDLVPQLVHVIHQACRRMGFQVLMISHHDPSMFQKYADRLYRCRPTTDSQGTHVIVERAEPRDG